MTAIIAQFVDLLSSLLTKSVPSRFSNKSSIYMGRTESSRRHSKDLVRPAQFHQTVEAQFVDQFDEVLVIGDVHGCFDELMEIIQLAQSTAEDPSKPILKVFVGDLINKGPKSKEVIDFVRARPNECLSVRGNHEEICIKAFYSHLNKSADSSNATNNGSSNELDANDVQMGKYHWARELSQEQIDYLVALPYTISLPNLNCIIVHAGLVAGLPLEKHDPYDLVHMRNYVFEDYFEAGGVRPVKSDSTGEPWAPNWPGPQHVYFGHNSKRGLQRCEFATGLDTGCVVGKQLTGIFIKGPRSQQLITVQSRLAYKVKSGKSKRNSSVRQPSEGSKDD